MIDIRFINSQPARLTNNPDEIRINCPECSDDKFHMYCNTKKLVYVCHKCGAKGRIQKQISVEDFTRVRNDILGKTSSRKEILDEVTGYGVKNLPRNLHLINSDIPPDHEAWAYLVSRGFDYSDVRNHDIRLCIDKTGPYANTVIFPLWDQYKCIKYFVCRRYTKQKPKYINAPWPKDNTLYCSAYPVRTSAYPVRTDKIIIVEGIIDTISIAKCGYASIALLGKVPTSQQLVRLAELKEKVFIYLDHDAFSQALDLKLKFAAMDKVANIIYDYKDANELLVEGNLERFLDEQTKHL